MAAPSRRPLHAESLRVLHLNTSERIGGAARAAMRLHQGLMAAGVDSHILVQSPAGGDSGRIHPSGARWSRGLGLHAMRAHLDPLPVELYRRRQRTDWDIGWLPGDAARQVARLAPDIVHLHWICSGFVSIADIPRFHRPIIWTLHDCWPFTGGCHVPFDCRGYRHGCGRCPQLNSSRFHDLSRWTMMRKKRNWQRVPLTIVAPSRWMVDCARSSALFGHLPIHLIPNGVDTTLFRPIPKELARELLRLPSNRPLILFGAINARADRNKGWDMLRRAIQIIQASDRRPDCQLVVLGAAGRHLDLTIDTLCLEHLHDEIAMSMLFSAVDGVVVPSLLENLSCMVMESMACATPAVAFDSGGSSDLIEHGKSGYLARPLDPSDLAAGICWVLENQPRRQQLGKVARDTVLARFDQRVVANTHRALYENVLQQEMAKPGAR